MLRIVSLCMSVLFFLSSHVMGSCNSSFSEETIYWIKCTAFITFPLGVGSYFLPLDYVGAQIFIIAMWLFCSALRSFLFKIPGVPSIWKIPVPLSGDVRNRLEELGYEIYADPKEKSTLSPSSDNENALMLAQVRRLNCGVKIIGTISGVNDVLAGLNIPHIPKNKNSNWTELLAQEPLQKVIVVWDY